MIKIIVKNGCPEFADMASMRNYQKIMGAYSNSGKILQMNIEEFSPNTTEKQHKLFKAIILQSADVSGFTYQEMEEVLTEKFGPYRYEDSIIGDKVILRKRVPEMTNKEFSIFLEQIIPFVNEFYGLNFELQ